MPFHSEEVLSKAAHARPPYADEVQPLWNLCGGLVEHLIPPDMVSQSVVPDRFELGEDISPTFFRLPPRVCGYIAWIGRRLHDEFNVGRPLFAGCHQGAAHVKRLADHRDGPNVIPSDFPFNDYS